jgi:hypothetical protein
MIRARIEARFPVVNLDGGAPFHGEIDGGVRRVMCIPSPGGRTVVEDVDVWEGVDKGSDLVPEWGVSESAPGVMVGVEVSSYDVVSVVQLGDYVVQPGQELLAVGR